MCEDGGNGKASRILTNFGDSDSNSFFGVEVCLLVFFFGSFSLGLFLTYNHPDAFWQEPVNSLASWGIDDRVGWVFDELTTTVAA